MKETFETEKYTAVFFLILDKILNVSVNLRFPSALENSTKMIFRYNSRNGHLHHLKNVKPIYTHLSALKAAWPASQGRGF